MKIRLLLGYACCGILLQVMFVSVAFAVDGSPVITWPAHDSGNAIPNSEDYYCDRDQTTRSDLSAGNKARLDKKVKEWCEKKFPNKICTPTYTTQKPYHLICGGRYGTPGAVPANWCARVKITCNCVEPPKPPVTEDPKPKPDNGGGEGSGTTPPNGDATGTESSDSSLSLDELDEAELEYVLYELGF